MRLSLLQLITKALTELAGRPSEEARGAALRIVTSANGQGAALDWAQQAGLKLEAFNSEGRATYLVNALYAARWDVLFDGAALITEDDYFDCPGILHPVAMAKMLSAIPVELRGAAALQVPFEAKNFPLASATADLLMRRDARKLFLRLSDFALTAGVTHVSNIASDYALWLLLRDPTEGGRGIEQLRDSMRDPTMSLRRVNLALQFGIQLDVSAIEARIDQSVALSGEGTSDEAFARLSLAFAQSNHKGVADYIAKHRAQLYAHLLKPSVLAIEIEALARAGSISSATERLAEAVREGSVNVRKRCFTE